MTWGIPTPLFLQIHVVLSLIGIATGLVMLAGMLAAVIGRSGQRCSLPPPFSRA